MRVLFAGYLGSPMETSWQRCETLKSLGCEVRCIDQSKLGDLRQRRFLRRVDGRAFKAGNVARLNAELVDVVRGFNPKVIWIEKGLLVQPETLREIKGLVPDSRLVAFQDDNPFGARSYERGFWEAFVRAIPEYDLHFMKRQTDAEEFLRRGAARVEIFTTGFYEPAYGRPQAQPPDRYLHSVSFVGSALDDRARLIGGLLERGMDLHVYGVRWERHWAYYRYNSRFHAALPPAEHADVIWRSKINLGFVSHSNGDEYNGRSFDIPAAGGFLLTERTRAHEEFFKEGRDAAFYGSPAELEEKVSYYLANDGERAAVARAGNERAHRDRYSLSRRLGDALKAVEAIT